MSLAHPYWLLALILLPLLVLGVAIVSRRHARNWSKLVAGRLRKSLIRSGNPIPRWLSLSFLLAATALIICGMARPRGDGGVRAEQSLGRNLLIALDLSRSMRVEDVQPDRLSLGKLVIYELLEAMPNDRIGLVGFAGEAHLYAPLTIDHAAVRETVEQMDETWPTTGGSDLGAAVELSIETLWKKTDQRNNAMILITDGEMHSGDLDQMILQAREYGVYIITIGVGTEDGGYVPDPKSPDNRMLEDGNPVLSRLQAGSLMKLARETNGSFALAGSGADIPNMVQSAIADLKTFEIEGLERRVYIEFYQWLVLPAILLLIASLIAGTRWRALSPVSALLLLGLMLTTGAAPAQQAQPGPEEQSMERYRQLAEQALLESNRARYRLGEATAAYRLQQWDRASLAYSHALQSSENEVLVAAHHGIGNTLFQKGWLRFLDTPYTAEIDSIPSMVRFEAAVREKLDELKNQDPAALESDESFNYRDIRKTILDWSDSVRHFQSVLDIQSDHLGAIQNRDLSLAYLRKLKKLLEEDEQKTEESMPESMPEPQGGEGDPNQQGDPSDQSQDQNSDGDQGKEPKQPDGSDPSGNQGEPDPNGQPDPNRPPGERPDGQQPDPPRDLKPGETPEDRARRILRESADSEKGPLTPGRFFFREPDKDW